MGGGRIEHDDGRTGETVQWREKRWDEKVPEALKHTPLWPPVQSYFIIEDALKRRKEASEGPKGSKFEGGGGTFRDPKIDPKLVNPVLRDHFGEHPAQNVGDMFGRNLLEDPKKVYDYEALKRLLDLLNADRERKPYGTPDNANIGF